MIIIRIKKFRDMFSVSTNGFVNKPSSNEIRKISYIRKDLSLEDVVSHIRDGHVLSANFNEDYTTTITQSDRRYDNFISTAMVMFDLDGGIDCSLEELIGSLKYIPTIAYTTFSHQKEDKGNRYRLLYLFEKPIENPDIYKEIYQEIRKSFEFKLDDNCGCNPTQAVFGSSSDCEVIVNDSSYSIEDFNVDIQKGHSKSIKKEENNIELESLFHNKEFEYDFYYLSYTEIIDKYKDVYPFFEHTPLHEVSDESPYIMLPKDYIYIKRYWRCERVKNEYDEEVWRYAKPRKIKDGEGRKRKLFLNAILRRKMIPNISFEHLLFCLVFELYYFYENSVDPIRKKKLIEIAVNAMKADIEKYDFSQGGKRPTFIVNDAYCNKYGVSRKDARNLSKKLINYEKIGELYDSTCTDAENIECFKQNGLDISIKTLQRFRRDMGFSKYKK